jgi:hypothetical protein
MKIVLLWTGLFVIMKTCNVIPGIWKRIVSHPHFNEIKSGALNKSSALFSQIAHVIDPIYWKSVNDDEDYEDVRDYGDDAHENAPLLMMMWGIFHSLFH